MPESYFHACNQRGCESESCDPIYKDQGGVVPKSKIKVLLLEKERRVLGKWKVQISIKSSQDPLTM